eukprot:364496-Chlamydomonas_euryale.AAC.63
MAEPETGAAPAICVTASYCSLSTAHGQPHGVHKPLVVKSLQPEPYRRGLRQPTSGRRQVPTRATHNAQFVSAGTWLVVGAVVWSYTHTVRSGSNIHATASRSACSRHVGVQKGSAAHLVHTTLPI